MISQPNETESRERRIGRREPERKLQPFASIKCSLRQLVSPNSRKTKVMAINTTQKSLWLKCEIMMMVPSVCLTLSSDSLPFPLSAPCVTWSLPWSLLRLTLLYFRNISNYFCCCNCVNVFVYFFIYFMSFSCANFSVLSPYPSHRLNGAAAAAATVADDCQCHSFSFCCISTDRPHKCRKKK